MSHTSVFRTIGRIAFLVLLGTTLVAAHASAYSSPALFNRTTFSYGSKLSFKSESHRYQTIVLQSTDGRDAEALHAADPKLRILMYSTALSSSPNDPAGKTTCTSYSSDNASHSSWFLTDDAGARIVDNGEYMMDMGNTSYQAACISHAVGLAKQYGFNGVIFDGLNSQWTWLVPSGEQVAKYPTTPDWEAAMQGFLNYAGTAVHATGLLVYANMGGTDTPLWEQWSAPLDGSSEQAWTDGGLGLDQQVQYWKMKLANVAWSEAHHKYALLNSWNRTFAGNTFGLASMLLVANGYASYADNNNNMGSYEPWYPTYNIAEQLGRPTGSYTVLSDGVYERRFADGLVLVNPSLKSISSIPLGGTYTTYHTGDVSSESLQPTSGLIMETPSAAKGG